MCIKIGFPSILNLKELYPYIKVIKAELVIKPSSGTYSYPNRLPSTLHLYSTDNNNGLNVLFRDDQQQPLTGNLQIDKLYGEQTQYTYNVTSFISNLIEEGPFSKNALLLTSPAGISASGFQRLIVNDQTLAKSIQLKLYILGL
jgi:hypothetical protein